MLINLSNHPSSAWSEEQLQEALKQFGRVSDLPFPAISPDDETTSVDKLADGFVQQILDMRIHPFQEAQSINSASKQRGAGCLDQLEPFAVHLMGELTFCFALAARLQSRSIRCLVSTTQRKAVEQDGMKLSQFNFVKFRDYPSLKNLL